MNARVFAPIFTYIISNLEINKIMVITAKRKKNSLRICLMFVKMPHEIVVFDLLWSLNVEFFLCTKAQINI